MPTTEAVAYSDPGNDLTCYAFSAITGRRFVEVAGVKDVGSQALATTGVGGNIPVKLATGAALKKPLGVSAYDQATTGPTGKVPVLRGKKVVPVEAGAAMTANDQVMSDGTGRAITYAPTASAITCPVECGVVLNSPTAAGQTAIVAIDL